MNEFIVGIIIGFAVGVLAITVACVINATPDAVLREVGIERIAYCCNAHSNWYEIVWKEGYK